MVFFNHATRQMTAKIVFYGPGLCGKTTNLNTIYGRTSQKARGEMVSLNTETDRTLFFDLLPMDVGTIGGFKTKLQLYTVPGQVFYNSTRKLVLKGVDGIVFVADSQVPMLEANRESLLNLGDNLRELGLDLKDIPLVFQWNKRDLKHIASIEELEATLNPGQRPSYQAVASEGQGVFETLKGITKLALAHIMTRHMADQGSGGQGAPFPTVPPKINGLAHIKAPAVPHPLQAAALRAPGHNPSAPSVKLTTPKMPAMPVLPRVPSPAGPSVSARMPSLGSLLPVAQGTLKVQLPGDLLPGGMEIRVQVLQGDRVLGETQVIKPAPGPGGAGRLTLEWKRD